MVFTKDLAGTIIKYNYRDQKLNIGLEMNKFSVDNGKHQIISKNHFGFFSAGNQLSYFNGNEAKSSLIAETLNDKSVIIEVKEWSDRKKVYNLSSLNNKNRKVDFTISNLSPNTYYTITKDGSKMRDIKSDIEGKIVYNNKVLINPVEITISKQ